MPTVVAGGESFDTAAGGNDDPTRFAFNAETELDPSAIDVGIFGFPAFPMDDGSGEEKGTT